MALKQCSECGHGMSTKAVACPSCGKKNGMGTSTGCLIMAGLFIILVLMWSGCPSGSSSSKKDIDTGNRNTSSSAWDGSVPCVEQYLKNTLRDPQSYKSYKWSEVEKNADGTYQVAHEYGAKNGFGGMVRETKLFIYNSKGEILKTLPTRFKD